MVSRTRILALSLAAGTLALAGLAWTPDLDRATLAARYAVPARDLRTVAGTLLHVRETGPRDAPAVLMVHGLGSSLQTWDAWAALLAREFRVIRIDLPGHGLSAPDASGDYSDRRSLELLRAVLAARGLSRAHVVGHSIGGRIAWTLAARHPESVCRLVLAAPDGFASPSFAYGQAPEVGMAMEAMRFVLPRWLLAQTLAEAYARPGAPGEAVLQRTHDLMRAEGNRAALLARLRQTVLTDPRPLLPRITGPTLLVWGGRDAMIPHQNAGDYLRLLPDARLMLEPEAGHVVQEEADGAPVLAFLRGGC